MIQLGQVIYVEPNLEGAEVDIFEGDRLGADGEGAAAIPAPWAEVPLELVELASDLVGSRDGVHSPAERSKGAVDVVPQLGEQQLAPLVEPMGGGGVAAPNGAAESSFVALQPWERGGEAGDVTRYGLEQQSLSPPQRVADPIGHAGAGPAALTFAVSHVGSFSWVRKRKRPPGAANRSGRA